MSSAGRLGFSLAEAATEGSAEQRMACQVHLSPYPDSPTEKVTLLLADTSGVGVSFSFNSFAGCFLCLDKDVPVTAPGKASVWA